MNSPPSDCRAKKSTPYRCSSRQEESAPVVLEMPVDCRRKDGIERGVMGLAPFGFGIFKPKGVDLPHLEKMRPKPHPSEVGPALRPTNQQADHKTVAIYLSAPPLGTKVLGFRAIHKIPTQPENIRARHQPLPFIPRGIDARL